MANAERSESALEAVDLAPCVFFLIEERIPDLSYELFEAALSEGRPGMVITRDYPPDIRRRHSVHDCPILWLTHLVGDNHINPTALGLLLSRITNFVDRNPQSVVLLDGAEYLISQNGYERILHFVHQVRDMIISKGCTMIMPIDVRVLSDKELAMLERNLEVLEPTPRQRGRRLIFELEDGLLKIPDESFR